MSTENLQVITNPYLSVKHVTEMVGLSTATIYRWMADGRFPKPVSLGTRTVRWPKADIEAWLEDRRLAS